MVADEKRIFRIFKTDDFCGIKSIVAFCPNCRRQVRFPDFAKNMNMIVRNGINFNCGNCRRGAVKIMPSSELLRKWDSEIAEKKEPVKA